MNDTIFALSTAFGKSGVAVFRISGAEANNVFRIFNMGKMPDEKVASLRKLYNSEDILIDECLVIYFVGPKSFTGQDIVELHTHGSVAVIKAVSLELAKHFRHANPGEFSLRSFLNGKMTLSEAEGLADLIDAETFKQVEFVSKLKSSNSFYQKMHNDLISLGAFAEGCVDFSEHTDEEYLISELSSKLNELVASLNLILGTTGAVEKMHNGIYVALLGAPNSGKSTLLNYITKRDTAIVSAIPGTTRDVIAVNMDLYGYPVTIADTAGLHHSSDEIESEGIKRSLIRAKNSDVNVVLFEYGQPADSFVLDLVKKDTLCFVSKCDSFYSELPVKITGDIFAHTLSVHRELGMERFFLLLKEKVEAILCTSSPFLVRGRHVSCVQEAIKLLQSIDLGGPIELISEDIRHACSIFAKITGTVVYEDILDEIFKRFCIGK